jgi:hypothetical protein
MTDELLATMKREWAEQLHFFSNGGKAKRERWVVKTFLAGLCIPFDASEVISRAQDDAVDVDFREARFQVKEATTPGEKRQAEIASTYRRVQAARNLQDTLGPGFVYDTPPIIAGDDLVWGEAERLANEPRYLPSKDHLDLLLYLTRTFVSMPQARDNLHTFSLLGWRSVSCLFCDRSIVLYAGTKAPEFLRRSLGSPGV